MEIFQEGISAHRSCSIALVTDVRRSISRFVRFSHGGRLALLVQLLDWINPRCALAPDASSGEPDGPTDS